MPAIDPTPNMRMYASRAPSELSCANTSAVTTPLPASRAVHEPDREPPCEHVRADVHVRRRPRVRVTLLAVAVLRGEAARAFAPRLRDRTDAEHDEHARHRELERGSESQRQRLANDEQHGPDSHERDGVADAPDRTDHRAASRIARLADERRDGGQVIGFERVAQPDEQPEQQTRDR